MGYLDKLKEICGQMTEVASDKAQIDRCAQLSVTINELEQEQTQMLKNYDELKASYKDAIMHGSYSSQAPKDDIEAHTKPFSFEEQLASFMANKKKTN